MREDLWVLDCSAVAAFLLNEEDGPAIDGVILSAGEGDTVIHVPALFWTFDQDLLRLRGQYEWIV